MAATRIVSKIVSNNVHFLVQDITSQLESSTTGFSKNTLFCSSTAIYFANGPASSNSNTHIVQRYSDAAHCSSKVQRSRLYF